MLCRVLLMNNSNYPWLILVPRREGVREIFELTEADQQQLLRESSQVSQALVKLVNPDKINIAALGNMVPQLHIHHIARFRNDPAWPAPVWGHSEAAPYSAKRSDEMLCEINAALIPGS